jgi:hypothetical protein
MAGERSPQITRRLAFTFLRERSFRRILNIDPLRRFPIAAGKHSIDVQIGLDGQM